MGSNPEEIIMTTLEMLWQKGELTKTLADAYAMKPHQGPTYFLDLLTRFGDQIEIVLGRIASTLAQPDMDYQDVSWHYGNFIAIARSIGAMGLITAAENLGNAIDVASKESCELAVLRLQQKYWNLRPSLDTIIQLERQIIAKGNQPRPGNS